MYHLGWFSTGRDEAAQGLLGTVCAAIEGGTIKAQIDFVFLSRVPGESSESDRFIELARSYGLPLICYSYQAYKSGRTDKGASGLPEWRLDYDREVMARLKAFTPDICVMAGYMLIVGPEMCHAYNLINLHPAAPGGPTGSWQEVIWQLIEGRAASTGVMMHLVTPELDRGPTVSYCTFSLRSAPFDLLWQTLSGADTARLRQIDGEQNTLFRAIREHGLRREFPLILSTIRAFSEGRVRISRGQVVNACGQAIPGYDLTGEIDQAIEE
ncbi:MAG: phosphoglycerate transporter [Dehalococcoidia bacterium]|nr:phosphoglycerate transporter [Dehalococcoidia bacterium]